MNTKSILHAIKGNNESPPPQKKTENLIHSIWLNFVESFICENIFFDKKLFQGFSILFTWNMKSDLIGRVHEVKVFMNHQHKLSRLQHSKCYNQRKSFMHFNDNPWIFYIKLLWWETNFYWSPDGNIVFPHSCLENHFPSWNMRSF